MKRKAKARGKATLEDVERQFEKWRRTRQKRKPIPAHLWSEAVKLSDSYPVHRISKRLKLNYTELKRRVEGRGPPTVRFVEVPLRPWEEQGGCRCVVEMSRRDGATLKMHFREGPGVDLVELGKLFLGREA